MFVPPYEPLLKSLNSTRDQAEAAQEIKVPLPLLKLCSRSRLRRLISMKIVIWRRTRM